MITNRNIVFYRMNRKQIILGWLLTFLIPINLDLSELKSQNQKISIEYFGVEQGLSSQVVFTIYQDRAGFLWFGTNRGLVKYDGYNFTSFSYTFNSNYILSI